MVAYFRPHQVLGLLWQLIRLQLMTNVNVNTCPELIVLAEDRDTDMDKLNSEQILLRWMNYHLKRHYSDELRSFNDITKVSVIDDIVSIACSLISYHSFPSVCDRILSYSVYY
jgi:hypothetical protein